MSKEIVSILVLVAIFAIGTLRPINMGLLGITAAFIVGSAYGVDEDTIFAGFPGDLFIILVGVTYLFAIANNNGTVDWLVHGAVRAVGGRVALIPWVMFGITAVLTAVGSVVPAAVAIIAPIALGFAVRYKINPVLMGRRQRRDRRRLLPDLDLRLDHQRRRRAQPARRQPDPALLQLADLQLPAQRRRVL